MAVDYVLHHPCKVRQAVPEAKLTVLVGYMATAQAALEQVMKSRPGMAAAEALGFKVAIQTRRPDGTAQQTPVEIRQLFEAVEPLRQHRGECAKCPANIADRDFGCYAKINYPIKRESEEWLLSRLPDDEKEPHLALLFKFLADLNIGGEVDALRSQENLFDLKKPVARSWGGFLSKKQITSTQVLTMLAYGGNLGAAQALLYTQLMRLETCLKNPHPPSANIEQFKTLMCAIVMAGRLGAQISIDP